MRISDWISDVFSSDLVDFAAPGGDMAAAAARGGYSRVRGTSFATPLVAGRLAAMEGSAAARLERAKTDAVDLGRTGADPVYGMGPLCCNCRNTGNYIFLFTVLHFSILEKRRVGER